MRSEQLSVVAPTLHQTVTPNLGGAARQSGAAMRSCEARRYASPPRARAVHLMGRPFGQSAGDGGRQQPRRQAVHPRLRHALQVEEEAVSCANLDELFMAWLRRKSFDDCTSKYDEPGFLSVREIHAELVTFVSSHAVEYNAGLTLVGLGRLLKRMLVTQRRSNPSCHQNLTTPTDRLSRVLRTSSKTWLCSMGPR